MSNSTNFLLDLQPYFMKLHEKLNALKVCLIALRPNQWTKNLLLFAAPFFAFQIDSNTIYSSFAAFSLFCMTSSSFYLLNDLKDIESDRKHPVKSKRPIAAGDISIFTARAIAVLLLLSVFVLSYLYYPALGAVLIGYSLIQIAYNLKLKRIPLLDIGCIASGFVLRTYAGFVVTELSVSLWFLVCTAMFALFLSIEKRKAELRQLQRTGEITTRDVLKVYSLSLLNRMESTVVTGAVMSYAIWSSGWSYNAQIIGAPTPWMILTLPFVIYGIFRYQLIGDFSNEFNCELQNQIQANVPLNQKTEAPEKILLFDQPIRYTIISWLLVCALTLWLNSQGII